jgi:hypothetical protein
MKTLEHRLVDTLHYEAERLPDIESARHLPASPGRSPLVRPGFAAPVAVVVVMLLAAPLIWLSTVRGGGDSTDDDAPTSQPPTTALPVRTYDGLLGSIIDLLPDGFDPEGAMPVFVGDGSVDEVVTDYFEARDLLEGIGIVREDEQDGYTLVEWAWGRLLDGEGNERGFNGWLLLHPTGSGFEILAATTIGVDLSNMAIADGHIRGVVRSDSDQDMGVDVLDPDGTPVDAAPNPEGMPDAATVWGTAAHGEAPLEIDLPVTEPVVVRVNLVGGAFVSIAEVAFGQGVESPDASVVSTCPVTVPPNPGFVPPDPYPADHPDESLVWYGTAELWTALDVNGNHGPRKEVWWSVNFPGGEFEINPELLVTATRLDTTESETTSNNAQATNAFTPGEGWFMMTGIGSLGPGCWEVTASYEGATVSYVYELD